MTAPAHLWNAPSQRAENSMWRRFIARAKAFIWSLVYEYRCAADWGAGTGQIITTRINKWTKSMKIIEKTVIKCDQAKYRTM